MLRNSLKCIIGTLLLTVAWSMTSCSRQQTVYANYAPIDDTTWEKTDTITFDVPPVKAAGTYQEKLGLRLADDFPFLALSMDIEIQVQPKGILHSNPKGKGLSLQQYTFDLGDLELEEGDSLHISMAHNMKREILPGVVDLGIILIKK